MEVFKGLFSPIARPQSLARLVWPRGVFRTAWSKTFLASCITGFLETNKEAMKHMTISLFPM